MHSEDAMRSDATSLADLLSAPMPLDEFFALALRITSAVSEHHDRSGYHGQLCPRYILIDAGGAVLLASPGDDARGALEGGASSLLADASLVPYLAPEATGRMNRQIDARADLYALGCIFHEMLAGETPFHAADLLGWIHAHVARTPPSLEDALPASAAQLARIVAKLLAKMAEDRYQSARGLLHDLERCRAAHAAEQAISEFPLGERDVPEVFQLPSTLYGRDEEIAALLHAFDDVVAQGRPALALVAGPSGIGKSSLVRELERPVVRERGVFASGKFDQQRETPYAAISQAFGQIARQLLTESEARLVSFRERLLAAVAPNGKLLTELVRELELVIGEQPPVPPAPAPEAQNRLHKAFLDMVSVLARKEHPLVLFWDDMQWADPGSLSLIQHMLSSATVRHLFVVCSYRDGEVGADHPWAAAVRALESTPLTVLRVTPAALTVDDVCDLVMDTFRCEEEQAEPLAALVRERTAGNPFFAAQLLGAFCQDGLIAFERARGAWHWDVATLAAKGLSGDVLALLADKMGRLSTASQRVLALAACIGSTFDPALVAIAAGRPEEEVDTRLRALSRAGFVELGDGGARFVHDRIWQAAYALIPEDEKATLHLDIGRRLTATRGEADLFERVNQFERGAALITDPTERLELARLDLLAARKALESAAFRTAARYADSGRAMLPAEAWRDHYELTWALHVEGATCENASGRFDEASALLETALERARADADRLVAHRVRMELRTNRGDFAGACGEAISCLAPFAVTLSLHPSSEDVSEACARVLATVGDRQIGSLIDLDACRDESMRAALDVLATAYAPAHWVDLKLVQLLACWIVELSLRYGNAEASVQGYAGFGAMLGPVHGRYREGTRFGQLAHHLAKRRGDAAHVTRACNVYGGLTSFWTEPLSVGLALTVEGLKAALQAGDLIYGSFHIVQYLMFMIQAGAPLGDVLREFEKRTEIAREQQLPLAPPYLLGMRGFLACLLGKTPSLSSFDQEGAEDAAVAAQIAAISPMFEDTYLGHKIIARTIARRYEEVLVIAERAEAIAPLVPGLVYRPALSFCKALALSALYDDAPPQRRAALLEGLRAAEALLGAWAECGRANHGSKHALILAELARIEGRELEAMGLYDRAIELAREHGLANDEALAHETAARFHERRGRAIIHRAYLKQARDAYARWGAVAKVAELEREGSFDEPSRGPDTQAAVSAPPQSAVLRPAAEPPLDMLAVVKAIQAISGEIRTEGLLSSLLRVMIEHAGAERCDLLFAQRDELLLAASAVSGPRGIEVGVKNPPEPPSPREVPRSIVGYVKRTREPLVLDDAASHGVFTTDELVVQQRTRSVLCMPVLRQSTLVGVIYLENRLARGVFTKKRLELLELLSAQAAISLENAALYEDVARERRRAEDALRENFVLIAQQEAAIESLSTPIIEVWRGVLAMPLFGAIDERRAGRMMTVLLDAVVAQQCSYAVLDVTGVATIDSTTAEHLVRLVRAVQLLGAKGIVAGMRPEVARAIVSLGVDLSGIETRANLREALVRCMRTTGPGSA